MSAESLGGEVTLEQIADWPKHTQSGNPYATDIHVAAMAREIIALRGGSGDMALVKRAIDRVKERLDALESAGARGLGVPEGVPFGGYVDADVERLTFERDEARELYDAHVGPLGEKIDALAAERDALKQKLAEAVETLKWIYHGHTDDVQNVRDVAKRRLDALASEERDA